MMDSRTEYLKQTAAPGSFEKIPEFFSHIAKKDWDAAFKCTTLTWQSNHKPIWIVDWFEHKAIKYLDLIAIVIVSPVMVDIKIQVEQASGFPFIMVRLICETAPYTPDIKGTWGINPNSCIRGLMV